MTKNPKPKMMWEAEIVYCDSPADALYNESSKGLLKELLEHLDDVDITLVMIKKVPAVS